MELRPVRNWTTRIYDILNVFEGLGLVTKCDINKYYWLGEEDGMIPTLRQLKTLANSENLVNIFMEPSKSDPNEKGKGKCSVQFLTGKMLMLFLILDPKEGLSKADFLKFILQNVSQKTKNFKTVKSSIKFKNPTNPLKS